MKRRVSNLMSAAFVAFMTLMCVWFGTPHQFDAPADNDADDLLPDDGEPSVIDDDLTYAFFLPLPADSALGMPLPPSVALMTRWQAQERDHA